MGNKKPAVPSEPRPAVRPAVRDLLTSTPAFRTLAAEPSKPKAAKKVVRAKKKG